MNEFLILLTATQLLIPRGTAVDRAPEIAPVPSIQVTEISQPNRPEEEAELPPLMPLPLGELIHRNHAIDRSA